MPLFLILPQFVRLLESWPKKFCCLPTSRSQLLSSVHILFCSVIPRGMRVVFVFLLPLTSRSGLKPGVASVLLSFLALVCSGLLVLLCPGLNCLFFFLSPRADPSLQSLLVSVPPLPPPPQAQEPGKGWCRTVYWD